MAKQDHESRDFIVLGDGGHAAVLIEVMTLLGHSLLGVCLPTGEAGKLSENGNLILGNDEQVIAQFPPEDVVLVNGVGSIGDASIRQKVFDRFVEIGFEFATVLHPNAYVSPSAQLGRGVQILANSVVNSHAVIDDNSIINSGAVVEHHCRIGKHCHIAPNATACGQVSVGDCCHIGAAAVVLQGVTIGAQSIIGAGGVVVKDVADKRIVKGVPAE